MFEWLTDPMFCCPPLPLGPLLGRNERRLHPSAERRPHRNHDHWRLDCGRYCLDCAPLRLERPGIRQSDRRGEALPYIARYLLPNICHNIVILRTTGLHIIALLENISGMPSKTCFVLRLVGVGFKLKLYTLI